MHNSPKYFITISLFTQPRVVLKLNDLLSSVKHLKYLDFFNFF